MRLNPKFDEVFLIDRATGEHSFIKGSWIIEWPSGGVSYTCLRLHDKTGREAYNEAKYFGAPVDRKWWQFWIPPVKVYDLRGRQ